MSKIELRASGWSKTGRRGAYADCAARGHGDMEYVVHLQALHEGGVVGYHEGFYTYDVKAAEENFGTRAAKNMVGAIPPAAVVQWLRDNKEQR